jgi:hypothetical protein
MLPLILPCSPSLAWTWIASIDIIDVFHMGLSCLHSYHHISYARRVDIQWALHILLFQLTFDPFDVATWHVFFVIPFLLCPFFYGVVKKNHHEIGIHLCQYMGGDWETLQEEHMIKTFAIAFCKCLESTPNPTPPPPA